jgi:hypothetical protein
LTPRQVRLAFSTVVKLSPPEQVNVILNDLLYHAKIARRDMLHGQSEPGDEQTTFLFAFVDCLVWIEEDAIEFWLELFVQTVRGLSGVRRESVVKRLWECISGEMGGERGLRGVAWWVNGGQNKVMARL